MKLQMFQQRRSLSDDNNLDVPSALEPSVHDLESESQLLIGQTAAQLPLSVP